MLIPQDFRGVTQIDATGRFLQYVECTSSTRADVVLWVDGQPVGTMLPGMSYELDQQCRRWELYPVDPACTGRVVIGDGRMRTNRMTAPVGIEGQALADVLSAGHFCGLQARTAGAALFPAVCLAAHRDMLVRQVRANWSGSLRMLVGQGTITTPLGTGRCRSTASPFAEIGNQQIQCDDVVTNASMPVGVTSYTGTASLVVHQSTGADAFILPAPMLLRAGDVMVVIGGTAAVTITVTFWGQVL